MIKWLVTLFGKRKNKKERYSESMHNWYDNEYRGIENMYQKIKEREGIEKAEAYHERQCAQLAQLRRSDNKYT